MFRFNLKKLSIMLFVSSVFLFNLSAELNIIPMIDFSSLQLNTDNYLLVRKNLMFKSADTRKRTA